MALMYSQQDVNPSSSLVVHGSADSTLTFQNRKCIGKFRIHQDKTYSTSDAVIPPLIPRGKQYSLRGSYLGADKHRAVLIPEYKAYHELRQDLFLRWITDTRFFDEIRNGIRNKPEFISFGSCMYMPMMTPGVTRFGDWEIYAMKAHDVIYLWDEKKSADVYAPTISMESYYGIYFEHLLTQPHPTASAPNEFEKVFAVNEINFGTHHLLCLNEIDAVNDRGEWVEIKVYKKCSPLGLQAKFLKFWAQSAVSGVQELALGERDDSGRLCSIEMCATDNLAARLPCHSGSCYGFQNRFLNWVKSHFRENNSKKAKKFSWSGSGNSYVHCTDVPVQSIPQPLLKMVQ